MLLTPDTCARVPRQAGYAPPLLSDLACPSSQVKDRCQRILSKQLGKILNSGFAPVRCPGTVSHIPGCQPSRWQKGAYLGTLTCKARLPKNSKSLAKGCSFVLSGLWFAEQRGERCAMTKFTFRNQRSFCSPWKPRSRIFEFLNKRVRGLAS